MWKNILLKRGSKLSIHAKKLLDEIIDSEPRSTEEILERMYDEVEKRKKEPGIFRLGSSAIPTRRELQIYLNTNYNSAKFSRATGKRINGRSGSVARYWK